MTNFNNQDFTNFVVNEFGALAELFDKKQKQYGTNDPLANFRTGALMNVGNDSWQAMYDEAKSYQRKHVAHIENCDINGPKVDESLKDIAVYAVIMLYMHKKEQESKGKSNE